MNLKQIINDVHQNARDKGFWQDYNEIEECYQKAKTYANKKDANMNRFAQYAEFWEDMKLNWIAAKLALIHSEVAELEEAEGEDNFAEELADICIRTFDLIGGLEDTLEVDFCSLTRFGMTFVRNDRTINWYISQALEHLRKENYHAFYQRLMDIYSRCGVEANKYAVNLEQAIKKKMEHNRTREYKHGKRL